MSPLTKKSISAETWEKRVSELSKPSPPAPRATDRLSTLPPELISHIFKESGNEYSWQPLQGAISKSLLPYTDANSYRTVYLDSFDQLELFKRTIVSDCDENLAARNLGMIVQDLEIIVEDGSPEDWNAFDVASFLSSLTNLQTLTMELTPHLTLAVLSPSYTNPYLPSLQKLTIKVREDGKDTFRIERFAHLASFPNLETLEFFACPTERRRLDSLPPIIPISANFSFPNIRSLELGRSWGSAHGVDLATFLPFFPNLDNLSLVSVQANFDFATVLKGAPNSLRSLKFGDEEGQYDEDGEPLPFHCDWLPRAFPHLETLKLNFSAYHIDTLLSLGVSTTLKAVHLNYEYDSNHGVSDAPLSNLRKLLVLGARPTALREINISATDFKEGKDLSSLEKVPSKEKVGWKVPKLPEGYSYKDVMEFVDAAAEDGVEITGSFMEGVAVYKKWKDGVKGIKRRIAAREVIVAGAGESV